MKSFINTKFLGFLCPVVLLLLSGFSDSVFSYDKDHYIMNLDELPDDLPQPSLIMKNEPAPGGIFLSPFITGPAVGKYANYLMIVDTNCSVVSFGEVPYPGFMGYHFKAESNGLLSYLARYGQLGNANLMDTSYNISYSLKDTANPYKRVKYFANFNLLPNGNILTARYDFQYIDMSKHVDGGEPNAAILQCVIQELDKDKNVIFQWRSMDYVPVELTQLNYLAPAIEYFHPNSMVYDMDGNIMISARNLNSIIKINRNTGEVMWMLGGKANEFTFIDEHEENAPNYFSFQHDIRRLPNGNITIFDNGVQHEPPYSRGVEYELDEENKTCKLVWEYEHEDDIYAAQHGSCQRLNNGNTIIGWGTYSRDGLTALTEVHPDNTKAFEILFPEGVQSQFIYKYDWPPCPVIADIEKRELFEKNTYDFNSKDERTGIKIKCDLLDAFIYNRFSITKYDCSPLNPEFEGRSPIVYPYRFLINTEEITSMEVKAYISLEDYPYIHYPEMTFIYFREKEGEGTFEPLITEYDPENNELITTINSDGEFVLAMPDEPDVPMSPIIHFPEDNYRPDQSNPVDFSWTPRGYFTSSTVRIAMDVEFKNIVKDTTTDLIEYHFTEFSENTDYYWQVRSNNEAGEGEWSSPRKISMSDQYIDIDIPDGGEKWQRNTRNIIRWNDNMSDTSNSYFRIELLKNEESVLVIKDSVFSVADAFAWRIPDDVDPGTDYKIKVINLSTADVFDTSNETFTIDGSSSVDDNGSIDSDLWIENYPNPFSYSTTFSFSAKSSAVLSLDIYDVRGKHLANLFKQYFAAGSYLYNWDNKVLQPGVYIFTLRTNDASFSGKMIIK